jgi:hypothetical protein
MSERCWSGPEGVGVCDRCGEPLDDDTVQDGSLEWYCGACLETFQQEAQAARDAALREAYALDAWERAHAARAA